MREVDAVNVVTQTFFAFSKLNITGSNFSDGKLLADSSILIFLSSRDFSLTPHSALQVYYNNISKEEAGLQPLLLLITINSFCSMYFLFTNLIVIVRKSFQ